MTDDAELLRRYAEERAEAAFAEFVQRHIGLVYAAARRRLGGDAHGAADVAQVVFVAAAREASALARHASVTGWLYTTTRNAALNHMREEHRRKQRERDAFTAGELLVEASPRSEWERLTPVLDAAMDELEDDDREAVLLIFAPGFSTAEKVSDISGRGVGMDVVRTNIENLGGSIDIDSQVGIGTRTRLKLPLTLAIIPSLLVRACGRRFAIPQVSLDELVRLRNGRDDQRIEQVQDAEVLRLRGHLLPLVRLSTLLGLVRGDEAVRPAVYVAVLKVGGNRYGLVVDEVLDSEEIVVKQLPPSLKDSRCYAGATIMGDGSVAMILDVPGIAELGGLRFTDAMQAAAGDEHSDSYLDRTESQTLLLFRNAPNGERFALNLAMISRIERVPVEEIQHAGGHEYLKFQDGSLRLLRLHDFLAVKAPDAAPREVFVIIPKLVKHPMGIIAWECDDVVSARVEVDRDNLRGAGILGSGMIDGRLTVFLDIHGLFELAEPEIYRAQGMRAATLDRMRVLLAEDTSFFRAVEKNYIEALGASVTAVCDGREAWRLLSEAPEAYDLVVTDIEMPLMDGLELTRHIRASERHAHLPVVALTSLVSDASRAAGLAAGVNAYEVKLDRERLATTIRQVMEEVCTHA